MSNQRENHREDVAGRANVEDTPELLAYYDQLEKFSTGRSGRWPIRSNLGRRKTNRFPWSGVTVICANRCCARCNW